MIMSYLSIFDGTPLKIMKKDSHRSFAGPYFVTQCFLRGLFIPLFILCIEYSGNAMSEEVNTGFNRDAISANVDLKKVIAAIYKSLNGNDTATSRNLVNSILLLPDQVINSGNLEMAEIWYCTGIYYFQTGKYGDALIYLKRSEKLFYETGNVSVNVYSKCLYNIGVTCLFLGDYDQSLQYMKSSSESELKIFGENSPKLIEGFLALSINTIYTRDYDSAIDWINRAIKIVQLFPDSVTAITKAILYGTKGVAYSYISNFDQAKINLEKAESFYREMNVNDMKYVNVLDNLGTVYHFLGQKEKSYLYFEKGMTLLRNNISYNSFNIVKNYAIKLWNDNNAIKGEKLLSDFLIKVKKTPDYNSRDYYLILIDYADYLLGNKLDLVKATEIYLQCFSYVNTHPWDKDYRLRTLLGYSLALLQDRQLNTALDSIQTLLFADSAKEYKPDHLLNPNPDSIISDVHTVNIFNAKFKILLALYRQTGSSRFLEAAANTSELIISVLEKIRFNIGEEGSRLQLGDRYREFYINAIESFRESYDKTREQIYLEKIFEYSEKSKVASLLASTRESKAINTKIPADLAGREKEFQRTIGFYNSKIAEEENLENPDKSKLSLWKDYIMAATFQRDSLLKIFEMKYPDYYSLKYNTRVTSLRDIPGLTGYKSNYVSYILSDTLLYTFVTNRKYRTLITMKVDSAFFTLVNKFRKLLISPDLEENPMSEYHDFQVYGHKLYSFLIEPIKAFLISSKLIISADNILSYLPFETLITTDSCQNNLNYRNLAYLMNEFRISYTYSATLLEESERANPAFRNNLIAFAPIYDYRSALKNSTLTQPNSESVLRPIPYSLEESVYITRITKGLLYSDTAATKSVYMKNAGNYDIIHLAMHTIINNNSPILSRMIFSGSKDSLDNSGLNISDIYDIPLRAKMVVLSSCNTGTGNLQKGEGVLSLARGFIYSGSKSVVLSLWEVNDVSGSEIVEFFYSNLLKGESKSEALRNARLKFLNSSTQLSSHPFFWSTLVIYGDDSSLYYSRDLKAATIIVSLILAAGLFFYFKKR
jgi:CHAT domain-containing protein